MFRRRSITRFGSLLITLALGLGLAACGGQSPAGAETTPSATAQRTILVSGSGHVLMSPDTALAVLGAVIVDPDLTAAQNEADRRMEAVLAVLTSQGIAKDHIKTVVYQIQTERDYGRPDRPVTSYTVAHMVQFTLQPPERIGAVVSAAVAAGANQINQIGFTAADQTAAVQQARELAIQDARKRADQLASLTGVRVGPPVTIVEGSTVTPLTSSVASGAGPSAAPTPAPIETGQLDVSVNVTVTYEIQ